jgi:Tetratricopeptide repeat
LAIRRELLEPSHEDTLGSTHPLIVVFAVEGRWDEAEELELKCMESCKRFGPGHPVGLAVKQSLAGVFRYQERCEEAEQVNTDLLQINQRKFGLEAQETLRNMTDLASTYREQRYLKKSEEQPLQVIKTQKRVLGQEDLDITYSMYELGLTYQSQERWEEAEEIGLQGLEIETRVLARHHQEH